MRVVVFVLMLGLTGLLVAPATAADPELQRIERQIWDDQHALERLGIYVRVTDVEPDGDVVQVDVITRRRDVKQVMADRYGPRLRVKVIADRVSQLTRTRWDSWAPRPGGRALRIWWETNSVYKLDHVRVREGRRRIVVTVIERAPNGPVTAAAKFVNHLVHLRRPVRGRTVIDGATGRKRPLGAGPGGP